LDALQLGEQINATGAQGIDFEKQPLQFEWYVDVAANARENK